MELSGYKCYLNLLDPDLNFDYKLSIGKFANSWGVSDCRRELRRCRFNNHSTSPQPFLGSHTTDMSTYPPTPAQLEAEEYELSQPGPSSRRPRNISNPEAPSSPRPSTSPSQSKRGRRTLTLHPNDTSATLLFTAPLTSGMPPSPRLRKRSSLPMPDSPRSPVLGRRNPWASFLDEDAENARDRSGRSDQVHVPDFGQMLGFNPEEEDHYEIARAIRSEWKRRLYLLMEEPRSGREAFFVHVFVTGAILFR